MQVQPLDIVPIIAIVMGSLTVMVPVSLVALRFAIKPIAEAIAITRSGGASQEQLAILEKRLALLEQQMSGVDSEVSRIADAVDFQDRLLKPEQGGQS
jgi:hypothetical protein